MNAQMNAQIQNAEEILCIYHSPCQDGFGAAWAMRHCMSNANVKFIPAKYGDEPPDVTGRIVYILDFSYSRETTEQMLKIAKRLLILDHHESALRNLVGLDCDPDYMVQTGQAGAKLEYHEGMTRWISDKGHILLDMTKSGAGIAWDYFSGLMKDPYAPRGPSPRPPLIDHIEDRDLWKFRLKGTHEITAALFSYPQDFGTWKNLMYGEDEDWTAQDVLTMLRNEGIGILRKQTKDIEELLSVGMRPIIIGGHMIPCCNLPYTLASEGCHRLLQLYPDAPFAVSYMDQVHGRVFSLRSEDSRLNVSEIARCYEYKGTRGGGHRNAAGFTTAHGWEGDYSLYPDQRNFESIADEAQRNR